MAKQQDEPQQVVSRWSGRTAVIARNEQRALQAFYTWQTGEEQTDEEVAARHAAAADMLRSGSPWLLQLVKQGRIDETVLPLLLLLRKRWLDEFPLHGLMEETLVDQALLGLYHQWQINDMLASVMHTSRQLDVETAPTAEGAVAPRPRVTVETEQRWLASIAACQQMVTRSLRVLYTLRGNSERYVLLARRKQWGGYDSEDQLTELLP